MDLKKMIWWAVLSVVTAVSISFGAEFPVSKDSMKIPGRWSVQKAREWYSQQPWLVGCNYIPANSINQLEMWQAETFDPATIERELQWAQDLGFNMLRVYLHDLVWAQDPEGLYERIDAFLDICSRHGMKVLFVFFDDCHHPLPTLGKQPLPVPEYHNSGWMNSPARDVAIQFAEGTLPEKEVLRLKGYVQETIRQFKDDPRVLMWELYNEPGNGRGMEVLNADKKFGDKSAKLVLQAWRWAREINPSQPVCSCAEGSVGETNIRIGQLNSDVISFHCYGPPAALEKMCKRYSEQGRPSICTEYMARPMSTFEGSLPVLKKYNVGAVNWGFVSGKSGTVWPWSSRKGKDVDQLRAAGVVVRDGEPYPEPEVWFHEMYRVDGTPYSQQEVDFIKTMTLKTKLMPQLSAGSE
jgi:hypothetical protein